MNKSLRDGAGMFLLLALGAAALVGIIFGFVGLGKLGQSLGLTDSGAGFFAIVTFPLCVAILLLVASAVVGSRDTSPGEAGEDS